MTKIADIIAQRALAGDDITRARNKINNMIRANMIQPAAAPGERIAREFDTIENVLVHIAFDCDGPRQTDAVLRTVLDDIRRQLKFGAAHEAGNGLIRAYASVHGDCSDPETWRVVSRAFDSGLAWLMIESDGHVIKSSILDKPREASIGSDWSVSVRLKSLRLLGNDMASTVERQKDYIEPTDLADEADESTTN